MSGGARRAAGGAGRELAVGEGGLGYGRRRMPLGGLREEAEVVEAVPEEVAAEGGGGGGEGGSPAS